MSDVKRMESTKTARTARQGAALAERNTRLDAEQVVSGGPDILTYLSQTRPTLDLADTSSSRSSSLNIPGLRDEAVKAYSKWHHLKIGYSWIKTTVMQC